MSAEGVRELCFINAVMNSHTTVWCNTHTWNSRCYPPLIPCIIGHFFSMTMKLFILPRWKSFNGHVFNSIVSLLSSCGGFCRDELSKTPIKDQSIQGGRPRGVKQSRCENVSWTCTLCTIIYTGWVEIAINDFFFKPMQLQIRKVMQIKVCKP